MTTNLQRLIKESAYYGSLPVEIRGEREIKTAKVLKVLVDCINKTLSDNGHLADGDVCTLIDLKRGLEQAERIAGGE